MEFLDSYFEDEVREGFLVSSLMKRAWAAQLQLFDEIRNVCEKHGITYFAEWGTLLGAVRHGGMIPWDDDMDICMKRKDFQRFLSVAKELPERCWILDFRISEDYDNLITKVMNSHSNFLDEKQLERYHGFPYRVGIDIFVYDFFPSDKKKKEEYISLLQSITNIIRLVKFREETREIVSDEKVEQCLKQLENLCGIMFDRKQSLTQQLYELLETRIAPLYSEQESNEVTNIPRFESVPSYRMPKKCYEVSLEIPFETTMIRVPAAYDQLLDHFKYKNYMTTVRANGLHDYPFYRELNQYVLENTETALPEYIFKREEIETSLQCEEKSIRQRAGEYADLFAEAGQSIRQFLSDQEYDAARQLLGDCQNLAIQIGTEIENNYGRVPVIEELERYCEFLYQIYEKLEQGEKISGIEQIILSGQEYDAKIQHAFEQFVKRREIVFVPYKSSYWHTMQPLWKQASEEKDSDVTVIPAPYYYRDCYGGVKKETMQYETENYPENVALTNYLEYDFKKHQPDVIVIQCPYDEYNYGMTMHPFFYARNLRQYTKELVYVPALIVDDTQGIDEHMKEMLRSYCNTPGVILSNKVLVSSETMKQAYVDILTEFAGEETGSIWPEKIAVNEKGKVVANQKKTQLELPEEWKKKLQKPDGSAKRVVLYTTSASPLYSYGDTALKRIENVLNEYKGKQEETVLWWIPDKNVREIMRKRNPSIWRKYCDILQNYKEAAWGILDDSGDTARALAVCDAAIGDGGVLLHKCQNAGKEIVQQKY